MTQSSGKHPDNSREQAMRDEMQFHVEMEADELQRMGVPADEAKRRALASFGGMRRYAEEVHDARRGTWREDVLRDLRYSLRSIARTPGYTFVVIVTLALAIAANTSIVSVANSVLFKQLP